MTESRMGPRAPSTGLRLSSRLLLANALTSLALLLIAAFIIYVFLTIRTQTSAIVDTDIENLVQNSRTARALSTAFSDIELLNRTFVRDFELLDSRGARLAQTIDGLRRNITAGELRQALEAFSEEFHQYLVDAHRFVEAVRARNAVDQAAHAELSKLEGLISDWLIESTLAGKDVDFVTQQLTLVNGFRESLLGIGKIYAEIGVDVGVTSPPPGKLRIDQSLIELALRIRTITASAAPVARHGESLITTMSEYRSAVSRVFEAAGALNASRARLADARARSIAAMARIEEEATRVVRSTGSRIAGTIDWAGTLVVLSTLAMVLAIFLATRRLIRSNIHEPLDAVLDGIRAFQGGDLTARISLQRTDEWSMIGQSLNEMAGDLAKTNAALQRSHGELEERVRERTEELHSTVEALKASELNLKEAQRIAHLGHWSWDARTGQIEWSEEQYRIMGFEPFDVEPSFALFSSCLHPLDAERVLATLRDSLETNGGFTDEYRIVRPHGAVRWIEAQGAVRHDEDEKPVGLAGTALDITERKRAERLLHEEKERALVTLHSIGDAVIATDARGRVEYLNPVAERLTGHGLEEARGQPLKQIFRIVNEETRKEAEDPVARCLREGKVIGLANHTVLVNRSGEELAIQDSAAPIKDPTGAVLGVVLVFSDVTEARRLSRQISYEARHDGLTSLPNRKEFERRLERVVETAHAESTENALCYLDLDQFKLINDTCGHVAGDEVLRQVGKVLQENVRHRDTIARLGGDEFGMLMEHCSLDEAQRVARKLVDAVSSHEFLWEDKRFRIGVSIGLVAVNEASADSHGLLSAADSACLMAKEQGRNRIHVYQEDDEDLARRHGEMQWAVRIPRALEEDSFRLYFQPMAPVVGRGKEGAHYEILIRLVEDTVLDPAVFFPAADRYQLSSRLDRWVIESTFRWILDHPEHLRDLFLCSINLSGHSLSEEAFLKFVTDMLGQFPIPPDKICFEITETVAIANFSRANEFMHELKAQGCQFALDDFGSGLSSFAYLKNLPVDYLKIDGLFVQDILDDSLDLALVRSINEIGQVLGMKTIAERVESAAILEKLREIGVDYAQGFEIGRPRPIDDLLHRSSPETG